MDKPCAAEGEMLKKSVWLKKWNPRYFRLRGRTLCYYENAKSPVARGEIPLVGARITTIQLSAPSDINHKFTLLVQTAKKEEHFLAAPSQEELDMWLKTIKLTIETGPVSRSVVKQQSQENAASAGQRLGLGGDIENGSRTASEASSMDGADAHNDLESIGDYYALSSSRMKANSFSPSTFEPPPPPPDATDPLSYLMSMNLTGNGSTPEKKKPKKPAAKPSLASPKTTSMATTTQLPSSGASPTVFSRSEPTIPMGAVDVSGIGLRTAVKEGDLPAVVAILEKDPSLSGFVDNQQQSVLHVAAMFQYEEISLRLIDAGANPTLPNRQGETALDVAPFSLRSKMKEKFSEKGGQIPSQEVSESVDNVEDGVVKDVEKEAAEGI